MPKLGLAASGAAEPPTRDIAPRIAALAAGYSLEVSSRSARDLEACRAHLEKGSDVYINFIAGDDLGAKVRCAAALRESGFRPVPHLGARHLASRAALDDFLARLAGEAGVDAALLIAGDAAAARGPFDSALSLLQSGLLEKHGIRRIGIAGYPEGHPRIAPETLRTAMADKLALAAAQGLSARIVTQFCFDADAIASWLAALRADGVTAPVWIGLAGPANLATLVRFALRCGVANSVRALTGRTERFMRLVSDNAPDTILRSLVDSGADSAIAGLHFFPFGGVAKSARWANAVARGRFSLTAQGGLDVEA